MTKIDTPYATSNSATSIGLGALVAALGTATTLSGSPTGGGPAASLSEQLRPWEPCLLYSGAHDTVYTHDWQAVLTQFVDRLIDNTIDPIPEFDAVISEHFWDLA